MNQETIWKFTAPLLCDVIGIPMPRDARVLDVQVQNGTLTFWAIVSPVKDLEIRRFRIAGTGHPIGAEWIDARHLATIQDREVVWHVFEPKGAARS